MKAANPGLPLLLVLMLAVSIEALAQDTPIGTLTIPEVTQEPVGVFSAGVSYNIPTNDRGSRTGGTAMFSTFTLTKLVDGTSPSLLISAASGRVFPTGRIDLYDAGGTNVLTTFELSNLVVLGAVVKSMPVGTSRALLEEVSLDYQKIKQTVMTAAGPVTGCWDRAQNAAC